MNISSRNGNGTTQACAACKYQRRKCAPDCILAPYFPHDRQRRFLNAHKLFGVSNINKIIKNLSPLEKDQAMRTIIIQSDIRATDPVGGCYRIIQALQAEIEYYRAELDLVLQQLAIVRAQAHHVYDADHHQVINCSSDPLNIYNPVPPSHYHYLQPQQQQLGDQEQYIMVQDDSTNNNHSTPLQQDVSAWAMENSVSLSSLSLHGKQGNGGADDYGHDHKPIIEMPCGERNIELKFQSQELTDRSDEGVLFKLEDNGEVINAEPECIQQVQDHDLKGAATLFTLTNCTS